MEVGSRDAKFKYGSLAAPVPKFRPGRTLCGARIKGGGIMPGSEEAITMHYELVPGLRLMLERCSTGSMLHAELTRFRAVSFWAWAWLLENVLRH